MNLTGSHLCSSGILIHVVDAEGWPDGKDKEMQTVLGGFGGR